MLRGITAVQNFSPLVSPPLPNSSCSLATGDLKLRTKLPSLACVILFLYVVSWTILNLFFLYPLLSSISFEIVSFPNQLTWVV